MEPNETSAGPPEPVPSAERLELSERERQILTLVATGASNKEIAQQLVISPNTVKVHLRNIFGKLNVASRTEAALYAIREGLAPVSGGVPPPAESAEADEALADSAQAAGPVDEGVDSPPETVPGAFVVPPPATAPPAPRARRTVISIVAALGLLAVLVTVITLAVRAASVDPPSPTQPSVPTALPRRITGAPLPAARAGMAVAVFEDALYAAGGETETGVVGLVERYDPAGDAWTPLSPMPNPVADAGAAVIGGLIYVPGGRTAAGLPSDTLAVYNPREDSWATAATMPAALSGSAVVAFEGKLYVFGGWDGAQAVSSVYRYDPDSNRWSEAAPMPTARAFAAAAVAGGRIYVVGGSDEGQPVAASEAYVPADDQAAAGPWATALPVPEAYAIAGITSVADAVYVVGTPSDQRPSVLMALFPQRSDWLVVDEVSPEAWSRVGVAAIGTRIHFVGGQRGEAPVSDHQIIQVIFNVLVPVVAP